MKTPAAVVLLLLIGRWPVPPAPQERLLESGAVTVVEIAGGATHDYLVQARVGEAIDVRATQMGIDLVLMLQDPSGRPLIEVDSPNGSQGDEATSIVAPAAGSYRVRLRAFDPNVGAGRYELRVVVRAATQRDIDRAAVHTTVAEARRLLAAGVERDAAAAVSGLQGALIKARALGEVDLTRTIGAQLLEADAAAAFSALGLHVAAGAVPVYFSRGFDQRARALRDALTRAVEHFGTRIDVRPPVALAVLGRADWQAVTSLPYGMPFSTTGRSPLVVMPAEHAMVDEFATAMKKQGLPSGEAARTVAATGLSLEDGLRLAGDDTMYHELGHILAQRYGIVQPNRWFGELMANYFGQAYLTEVHPDPRSLVFGGVFRGWFGRQVPTYTSLEDLERVYAGMEPANYGWYQAHIEERALDVFKTHGLGFLPRVKAAFPEGTPPSLPVSEVLARLERAAPGFEAWARGLKERAPR